MDKKIPEKTVKEGHQRFLDFKSLKLLKNGCLTRVNNCKFTKDNSMRAILLKRLIVR